MIRRWRLRALKENTAALGTDYCASLFNLSEIGTQESTSNASGGSLGSGETRAAATKWEVPRGGGKGTPGPNNRPPKRGAPVRRADTGDIQAVEREL